LRILQINYSDSKGGAARAAMRIHEGLSRLEVESLLLVSHKTTSNSYIISPKSKTEKINYLLRSQLDQIPVNLYKNRNNLFSPSWVPFSSIINTINNINPDLVHLHWVTGGMIRIEDLLKVNKPIVWTLHDMWAFTGGCHIDDSCGKYKQECNYCPVLGSNNKRDLSSFGFKRKQRVYEELNQFTLVGPSQWMVNSIKSSRLMSKFNTVKIPNPIDLHVFKPLTQAVARSILNIDANKRIILFGATNATGDINKGYKELYKAIELIDQKNTELYIFGATQEKSKLNFNCPVKYLGLLHDDISLMVLYSAADVMVVPSKQETFGQTALEAMACGTPVVAYGSTGLLDIVDHQENGYLAKPSDSNDLANGIEWVLSNKSNKLLFERTIEKVRDCFDLRIVAQKYRDLYMDIIKKED